MLKINEKLVKFNYSSRKNPPIKYIAIHDTGNTSSGADAERHFLYFNAQNRGKSAHYFVDDKQILRIIKDVDKSWHCGDGKGKYDITNENSIGIEMCINVDADQTKVLQNTIDLTKELMQKYNIPVENVVRHYDASRKNCPNSWKNNDWAKWKEFKEKLTFKQEFDFTNEIKLIYVSVFKREIDHEGLEYWKNRIKNIEDFGKFVKDILYSDEFRGLYNV